LIELTDVKICYGPVEAVKGISMKVDSGVTAALIGSNGAGKSTILRAISGLTPPSSGEIYFNGERIDKLKTQQIVGLGIAHCPEGRRVFPRMTVMENLNMGAYHLRNKKKAARIREDILEWFPILRNRSSQDAGTLSGGEQQMLAIGRTLMSNPKLILLDEPSLGLSPLMVQEIAKIIETIKQRNIGIILVEQNANMALDLSSVAFVLSTGRIVLSGAAKDLKNDEKVKRAYLGG
jgi:branched-chain amino acid transport system ATP-binding protein